MRGREGERVRGREEGRECNGIRKLNSGRSRHSLHAYPAH